VRTPLALDQLLGLEPIQQPRDAGRLLDHARGHFERRHAVGAAAAQDAQYVVLLQRDAVRIDDARQIPAHHVGRPHQRHHGLLRRRRKRCALPEFVLEPLHTHYITCH